MRPVPERAGTALLGSPGGGGDASRGLLVEGVTAGYGARTVLHQVSLAAWPGQVTGLIGPNGSGKTTLVRVASRGLGPREGSVRVGGSDPYAVSARVAARLVAVVPQEVAPAFSYSVLEMVLMGRSAHLSPWGGGGSEDWAHARRAMANAAVEHLADRAYQELSAGERQRVIVAQALAQDAPVLLLDEPTTHLDLRHVVEILALVRGLARSEGKAVLAIFHDLNLASVYCDRIDAMVSGRIVASGPPSTVLTSELVSEVFGIEAEVWRIPGRPSVVVPPPAAL
ncbi:MAG: ABC transporter ATP-binding protein [Actinomycetota bacterium]